MRQVIVSIPPGHTSTLQQLIEQNDGVNIMQLEGENAAQQSRDIWIIHVQNHALDPLMQGIRDIPDSQLSFLPQGVLSLREPTAETPEQVINITRRSAHEIYLSGLQSIGSWSSFLSYGFASAVIVWIGLFTNSVILLVGAMLIAPFASPALNTAIASARGDSKLLKSSLMRYAGAILVTVGVAAGLTLLTGIRAPTDLMLDTGNISSFAVLLPLIIGAAGALNLSESPRSSLVSGAATGLLIAAALSPPTAVIGIALVLGHMSLLQSGIFLVLLQLVAINVTGAVVFRWHGIQIENSRYDRGRRYLYPVMVGLSVLGTGLLLVWQFSTSPDLQRSSLQSDIQTGIQERLTDELPVFLLSSDVEILPNSESNTSIIYTSITFTPLESSDRPVSTLEETAYNIALSYIMEKTESPMMPVLETRGIARPEVTPQPAP
jgi:uncharacterized membrane protein